MDLGPHAIFIVAAYAGVTLVTLALIGFVWAGARRSRARLDALEAQGIRRRSDRAAG